MEKKTKKTINLLILLLIIETTVIIVMAAHIVVLHNELLLKDTLLDATSSALERVQDNYEFNEYLENLNEETEDSVNQQY